MAKKVQKNYRIDAGVAKKFSEICDAQKIDRSAIIEELMKGYIARDGEMLVDDIYAPRIAKAVELAVDKQVNRLAKMIYQTQVDATATVYAAPLLHNIILRGMEDILEMYINPQLLDQNRLRISDNYTLANNGKKATRYLRNLALSDHKEMKRKKKAEENKPEEDVNDVVS